MKKTDIIFCGIYFAFPEPSALWLPALAICRIEWYNNKIISGVCRRKGEDPCPAADLHRAMKKWNITRPNEEAIGALTRGSDLEPLCAAVLASRGIRSVQAAAAFLGTEELSDPFLIRDMQEAVEVINQAVESGSPICVYGDYDCDGVTATVMLYSYLECLGADVRFYIPERSEGYGMNEDSIRRLAQEGVSLIVTVDNGIAALAEAELIARLGMTLVVTDHHQPGEQLPEAAAVINPHRADCPSPYKNLCGAGVALKLIAALDGGGYDMALEQFGDLAAIGTVADIVPLDGENRFLVRRGLEYLQNTEREGLLALIEAAGLSEKPLDAHSIGFMLAPRLNAAGRFGSPSLAVRLLLSDDPQEAAELAAELDRLNTERKTTENAIMQQIGQQLRENPALLHARVLVLAGEGWHPGVIGILAARLVERFGKPCFLLSIEGDTARGSARSFGDFSVYQCLHAASGVLTHWGGHKGAGGMTLGAKDLPEFDRLVQQYAKAQFPGVLVPELSALLLPPAMYTPKQAAGLGVLAPFGAENPEPLFAVVGASVTAVAPTKNGQHSRITLRYGGVTIGAFWFFCKPEGLPFRQGDTCDVLLTLQADSWNGKPCIRAQIRDGRLSGTKQSAYFAARASYEAYLRQEALPVPYYGRMLPTRQELVRVYTAIGQEDMSLEQLYASCAGEDMNYCKFRICCDIFAERGLIALDTVEGTLRRLPVTAKVQITESQVYVKLHRLANNNSN